MHSVFEFSFSYYEIGKGYQLSQYCRHIFNIPCILVFTYSFQFAFPLGAVSELSPAVYLLKGYFMFSLLHSFFSHDETEKL